MASHLSGGNNWRRREKDKENKKSVIETMKKRWKNTSFFRLFLNLIPSISHSTWTIKDKIYSLIINSGSYKNMVFIEEMRKLQLATESHHYPYKLMWLNKNIEVIVKKCCLVFFFMRLKYFDSALCDVVSIDMWNVLLRRLW